VADDSTIISYRIPDLAPGIFAIMGTAGAVALVLSVIRGGPVLFILVWLGMVGWLAFNFLVRMAHAVAVTNGKLFWTSYVTTTVLDLSQVVRMRLAYGGSVQVIECRDGRKLRVPIIQGYQRFIVALAGAYPKLNIEEGRYSRLVEQVQIFRPPGEEDPGPSHKSGN
jgi:hypothetical protein